MSRDIDDEVRCYRLANGNCPKCVKPRHDGMTCDYAEGYRCALRDESDAIQKARAEIVAKLRERAKRTAAVAGENWAIDTGPLEAAAEFDLAVADWIEAGCP